MRHAARFAAPFAVVAAPRRLARAPVALALLALAPATAEAARELTEAQRRRVTPVVEVVQSQVDAVVNVSATHVVQGGDGFLNLFFDVPRTFRSNSVGSGAIIHPSGYVLTNAHVVARASELSVVLKSGRQLPAVVVAQIPEDDVAIMKVELPAGERLPSVRLGRSDDLLVGETVVAIGNPVGLQHSVTTGIVSAVGRTFEVDGNVRFDDVIQTDAAINPGNSGGPLFNILGEQIGVNTAIRSDAQNVGFAIPIDRVKALLPRLLAVESRGRVRLGLSLGGEVQAPRRGVLVGAVEKGGPAARAGLQPGMLVESVGGRPTPTLIDALVALLEQPAGKPFVVRAVRADGAPAELRVAIEDVPPPDGRKLAAARFGLVLDELDGQSARRLGLRAGAGLLVREVDRRSPAARAGIVPGDLVVRVGPYGVRTLEELGVLLEPVAAGDRVPLRVVRIDARAVRQAEVVLVAQ